MQPPTIPRTLDMSSSKDSRFVRASTSLAYLESFAQYLSSSRRILALVGAGLSAPSGIPTFRGADGLWRQRRTKELASPYAFRESPVTVWQFYSERRHNALAARPNQAHYALAELARKNKEFITINQNVDGNTLPDHKSLNSIESDAKKFFFTGLSERAGHPLSQLYPIHGSLFSIRCTSCDYFERENFVDPIVPPLASVSVSALPHCTECGNVLRPGVVWFGERLPDSITNAIENWISAGPIDLILVIGTSLSAFPAAEYVELARTQRTRVVVVNMDREDELHGGMRKEDWFFQGDAAIIVPEMLKSVTYSYRLASGSLDPNSATDDELVHCCFSPNRNIVHHMEGGITVVRISKNIAIKFGYGITEYEANSQRIARELVDPTIVRIPSVHRFIQAGEVGYIVMEYVEGHIGDVDPSRIASIIAHFAEIKSSQVGPLAGGYVRGQVWTEDLDFTPTSLQDIEKYYNKVLHPQKLKLDGSDIVLCHLDIAPRNIISLDDSICLLDWQSAGFYPRVFEYCALRINQQNQGDLNTCLADAFQLTSYEQDQAKLILQAWSIFQRHWW